MKRDMKLILFAFIIAVLIPTVIIKAYLKAEKRIIDETEYTNELRSSEVMASDAFTTGDEQIKQIMISVLMDNGQAHKMELNAYLTGVVLGEMPTSFEVEALKAQAIVARTYTLQQCLSGNKHGLAKICTDPSCCQAYCSLDLYLKNGGDPTMLKKVEDAVSKTNSMVLLYGNELIEATYFSCSGGRTEDAKDVWGTDVPYLQSVESPGEEIADCFLDTIQVPLSEFLSVLEVRNNDYQGELIGQIAYTDGGGVDIIEICGQAFKGTDIRSKLGLRSTQFLITVIGETVTITTKGFGHRVGMSQYGAEVMAVKGCTCSEILAHYYQGTELSIDFLERIDISCFLG